MESKTLAIFDSTLWFVRVGVAAALLLGTVSDANANARIPYPQLADAANVKVQLVRKLPERKSRRFNVPVDTVCAIGEA
ncbi:MAG: hypothetical protein NW220_10470 [Leptolyngbyaceae cyanobacterium bins.349]|nr:hypothetical protein [Leptolyngbyaceae cyanobacterium bins.349]